MSEIPRGAIRFNTDSNKPELWDGSQWAELQLSTPNLGQGSDTQPGARGLIGGGQSPAHQDTIDYINIDSTGNATDFGNLTDARSFLTSCSSSTRALFGGGYSPGQTNTIDYVTISSTGNASDYGDLSVARYAPSAVSSSTRGVFAGGYDGGPAPSQWSDTIDYVTIATTGNAQDFGNLESNKEFTTGFSSPVRGVFNGGGPSIINVIQFITIATLGNTQDFGDLTTVVTQAGSCSNATRGLIGGGFTPTILNTIQFVTISTLGNAIDFGDLTAARSGLQTSGSSSVRGTFAGGDTSPAIINVIDYVIISTQGDAVDFGDLTRTVKLGSGCSNAHGGL